MKIAKGSDSSLSAIGEAKGNESINILGAISYDSEEDVGSKQNSKVTFECDKVSLGSEASFGLEEIEIEKDEMVKILDFTALINSQNRTPKKATGQTDRLMESTPNLSSGYGLPGDDIVEIKRSNSFSSFSNLEVTRDSFEAIKEEAESIKAATRRESWMPRASINVFDDDWDDDSEAG